MPSTGWGFSREEFQRLGVIGDWKDPYTTMAFPAEAQIARELMKFAVSGQLYRGSKPVMWSVVEKTALAEAEVEYQDYTSDTIYVKFPVAKAAADLGGASVVIWTTTPWTIPGNRAISYSPRIAYGLYRGHQGAGRQLGEGGRSSDPRRQARSRDVQGLPRRGLQTHRRCRSGQVSKTCDHPLKGQGYDFAVPLLAGDHVTDDAGTGFVHTAPGHGADDFEIWEANLGKLKAMGINTEIPFTVDADGVFTAEAPGFAGKRVLTDKGEKGDANEAVIQALLDAGMLIARGRLKHQYPHSLALQEADHLPQYAAMVHLHGRRRGGRLARQGAEGDRRDRIRPARRPEPPARHDRSASRLGDLAPACLGCADRRLRQQGDRTAPQRSGSK